jgi:hypothetical protein
MNRRALFYALAYSVFVIAFKLYIVLGTNALNSFGFNWSQALVMFMIIPFYLLAIKAVRDKEQGGFITGREALRISLTVFAVSAIILSIYNYIEFQNWGRQLAAAYYNSETYLAFLKRQTKVKPDQFPKIISEQIAAAQNGAFVATSVKLFGSLLIGVPGALFASLVMKRRRKQVVEAGNGVRN